MSNHISKQIDAHELYYQSTDFIAEVLADKYIKGDIIIPDYQRKFQWNDIKQAQFIESVFLNLPAPSMFFTETKDGFLEVADGSQRLRTLVNFFTGKLRLTGLELLTELNNVRFNDLDVPLQRRIKNKPIKGYIFLNINKEMTKELFERVNRQSSATGS